MLLLSLVFRSLSLCCRSRDGNVKFRPNSKYYCLRFWFSIGIIVGMKIEEKLALGYTVVNVTSSEYELDLPRQLRDLGYGVTHYTAYGRDGDRLILQILTPRRFEFKLIDTIKQIDNKAFIVAYEPRTIHGGFWAKGLKSKKLKQYDTDEVESI